MQRRKFLAASIAAPALAMDISTGRALGRAPESSSAREFYELRRYALRTGREERLTRDYLQGALVPALNRLGLKPVGVFGVEIGPSSPSFYVLIPAPSAEKLARLKPHLAADAEYMSAARPFLTAPDTAPAFERIESWLLEAFEGAPRMSVPPAPAPGGSRIFELRTYESPSQQDHDRKVEMFNRYEIALFPSVGFHPVFYGENLIGSGLPSLTYLLAFDSIEDREKKWAAFFGSDVWKKITAMPRYTSENIVSSITNLILSPAAFSQIQ